MCTAYVHNLWVGTHAIFKHNVYHVHTELVHIKKRLYASILQCNAYQLGKKESNFRKPYCFGTYSNILGTSENFSSSFKLFLISFMLFL